MGDLEKQLHILAVERRPEACLGCGFEHGCSVHGCAVIKAAIERLEARSSRLGLGEYVGRLEAICGAKKIVSSDYYFLQELLDMALEAENKGGPNEANGKDVAL